MAESDDLKEVREAIERVRALEPVSARLRAESERLKEEMDVLIRARDIMRERREKRENAGK